MSCPIGPDEINKLKLFIGFCNEKPEILNLPQLAFFKTFVEKLGGTVPSAGPGCPFTATEEEYVFNLLRFFVDPSIGS